MAKKIELTADNQKNSKKYLEELDKLFEMEKQYKERQKGADAKLQQLRNKMIKLESDFAFELDESKRNAISNEKREVFYEIQELESLTKAKVDEIMRHKFKEIQETDLYKKAEREMRTFANDIKDEIKAIEEESKARILELQKLQKNHVYQVVIRKTYALQNILRKDIGITKPGNRII